MVAFDRETGAIEPDPPSVGSGLRWQEFIQAMADTYQARFGETRRSRRAPARFISRHATFALRARTLPLRGLGSMESLPALIVVHLRQPPPISRVAGVSTMLAARGYLHGRSDWYRLERPLPGGIPTR